jgi:hypothetical protein
VQGCQMVYFQTKHPVLVHFGRLLNGNALNLLCPFEILCGRLLYFKAIRYTLCTPVPLSPFWYIVSIAIWQPCFGVDCAKERSISFCCSIASKIDLYNLHIQQQRKRTKRLGRSVKDRKLVKQSLKYKL